MCFLDYLRILHRYLSVVLRPHLHCIGSFSKLALLFFSWFDVSQYGLCSLFHTSFPLVIVHWLKKTILNTSLSFIPSALICLCWTLAKWFNLRTRSSMLFWTACCLVLFFLYLYMWMCWCKLIQVLQSCLKDPDKNYQEKVDALLRAWETLASYTNQSSPRDNVDYLTENLYRYMWS